MLYLVYFLTLQWRRQSRDPHIKTKGIIHNKSTQTLTYADDTVTVGRSIDALKKTKKVMKTAYVMGLTANRQKSKDTEATKNQQILKC